MADFDPDAFFGKLPTATPTKGAKGDDFDPDAFFGPIGGASSPSEPAKDGEDTLGGRIAAAGEAFGRGLPSTAGFFGTAGAAGVALVPVVASIAPAAPHVAAAIEIGGPIIAGMLGAGGVGKVTDWLSSVVDPEGYAKWKETQKQYPGSVGVGEFASGFAGSSYKTAAQEAAKWWTKPSAQRAISGGAMFGLDVTQQAVMNDGNVNWKQAAAAGVGGTILPGSNVAGNLAHNIGARSAAALKGGKKPVSEKPPADAPPEVRAAYVEELKRRSKERDAKAPLEQTAFRKKDIGKPDEIIKSGPKHSEELKADASLEQGFVDERGNFHTREEAIDQAKRAGQIPEDHVLENPPGEQPGLHSGDMRKAGVKGWEVTPEQPAGTPKPPVADTAPKSRKDFKKAIDNVEYEYQVTLELQAEEAARVGDEKAVTEINAKIKELETQAQQLRKDMPAVQFENHKKPTWEELHDVLWNAKTVGEAFDRISQAGIGSTGQKFLLAALNRSEFIRKASFNLHDDFISYKDKDGVEKKDAAGLYTGNTHNIDLGKGGNLQALLHEGVHAGTHALIESGKSKAAIELKRLLDFHKDSLGIGADEAVAKFQQTYPKASVKSIAAYRKYVEYGITNEHEFIAEAFTNKEFQKLLAELPADTNRPVSKLHNLWESFKQAITDGLGLKDRTALDDVLETGAKLIEGSRKKDVTSSKGGAVPATAKEDAQQKLAFERDYAATKAKLTQERQAGDKDKYTRDIQQTEAPTHEEILAAMPKTRDTLPSKALSEDTSPEVAKAAETVDPRSIPNEGEFYKHATDVYERYGEAEALKFFEDYKKNQAQRSIPVRGKLEDVLHKIKTFMTADSSEFNTWYREAKKQGVSKEQTREWFDMRERGEELPPEGKAVHEAYDKEQKSLYDKAVAMGLPIGAEYKSGQSRIRLYDTRDVTKNFKDMVKEFFSDKSPMTEKMAEQADSAIERKVYQLDDGRVIEIHRIQEDAKVPMKDKDGKTTFRNVRKGTEVWEWNDGKKKMIGHTKDLNFKMGDKIKVIGKDGKGIGEQTMVDGKVGDIETHSPYRYLHDSMASQALAIMGLRKMVREAELLTNLKNNADFKRVAHSPDQPIETIPKGWKTPESIEKIPQLRGYHFDPKTAAIIEDFARVYDPTVLSRMTAALVKNMMLNPIPHMFNEAMHLYNARGFTGWVDPRQVGSFATTARQAWRDVGQQTQFYRDIMKEGGSVLGADPRNKMFDAIIKENSKEMFKQPEMQRSLGQLAKKLGTTVGDLYNGISNKSQQAMWFTRDVMYVQYIREIMARQEKSTGVKMELKDAIAVAEQHMPNYRMPSEVLGSRGLSKVLKNPNISMFSRYHYGMVKSLVNTLKDVNPQNLKTPEGRKHFREGVDSMLAIGVAMGVLYPLMDTMAEAMFGEGAEQRRAGPYHLLHAGEQVAKGEKDLSALVWPIFTFNPMLLTLGQLAFNKNIFTGKKIYHPEDPAGDIAKDVGTYGIKQVPQAPALMGAIQEEGGEGQFIAKQLDIKVKTERQRAAERAARKREAAAAKGRITKREKGTYRP